MNADRASTSRKFCVGAGECVDGIAARVHYRRVNQAEPWMTGDAVASGARLTMSVPAPYADSPFPLQYFVEVQDADGNAGYVPGLDRELSGQPYWIIRQTPRVDTR